MKRIHAAALSAMLVGAATASAQQPPARPDVIVLTGQDGTPHRCKVLRMYKQPSGVTACDVRDETNGELLTVIEDSSSDTVKAENKAPAVTTAPKPADPILQPIEFANSKAQEEYGKLPEEKSAPAVPEYTEAPAPAARRWFSWLHKDRAPKTVPLPVVANPMPAGETLALYHPDPVIRLIGCMSEDLLPSMREVSAETLAQTAKDRPEVVEAMIRTAQIDPAPSVRVCCCRCLVEMQVRCPECVAALKAMQEDREPAVRTAAAAALGVLDR